MRKNHLAILLLAALLLVTVGTAVVAQSSANFDLSWNVIGSGGGETSSANYAISGTVGQNLVGNTLSGSSFELNSGYWAVGATKSLYLPIIIRN